MSVRHFASSRNWATENVVLSVSVGLGTTVQYHYSACGSHAKLCIVVCFLPCENWFSLFKTWHLLIIWCTRTHQKCIRKLEWTNRTEKQKILTTNTYFHTGKDRKKSFVSLQLRQHLVIQSFCFRPSFIERVEIENEKKCTCVCITYISLLFCQCILESWNNLCASSVQRHQEQHFFHFPLLLIILWFCSFAYTDF